MDASAIISDKRLVNDLVGLARAAGDAVMQVYASGFTVDRKADGSPVTEADRQANAILATGLPTLLPGIPVVSEEDPANHGDAHGDLFLLVDPLDGTREFEKRDGKGAFTVNIGLVEKGEPVLGVVFAPALNRMFFGGRGAGAREVSKSGELTISARGTGAAGPVALASESHRVPETDRWLRENQIERTVAIGSSLKFGLLAAGEADVYPRFGPTMEWDTAAGDAVLRAAGGTMKTPDGGEFSYGKPGLRNGPFIARASR